MSRRLLPVLLFVLLLVVPFAARWAAGTRPTGPTVGRDARRLVVISPHAESIRSEFAAAFSDWHQRHFGRPVFVDYRIYGGATDIQRFFRSASQTIYKSLGTYQIDLVWGGGDDLFDRQLRQPGYLEGVKLPADVMAKAYAQ